MPTSDERLAAVEADVAAIKTRLGMAPAPSPAPAPSGVPAKPTGLACTIGPDGAPVLTWAAVPGVTWEVRDVLNSTKPVQESGLTEPRSVRSPVKPGSPPRRYVVVARNAAGPSQPSDPVDVPAIPAGGGGVPAPAPAPSSPSSTRYPADICGRGWYLTLPTGKPGAPDTIHQPALATYTSRHFELTPAGDGAVFRVWPVGAVTTKGSPNPRSELRECSADGSKLALWSAAKGKHSLTVEGQVNRLTKVRPHVVCAQIHGQDDDVSVLRLEGDHLWITDGDNNHGFLVDPAFTLGARYSFGFDVADGVISYRYNGHTVPFTLRSTDPGCYFKAGAYCQSNATSAPGETADAYCEAVIFHAGVTHAS